MVLYVPDVKEVIAAIRSDAEIRSGNLLDGGPTMDIRPIMLRANLAAVLSPGDVQFLAHLFQGFILHKSSQSKLNQAYLRRVVGVCQDFCVFAGKAPWHATTEDLSRWTCHLGIAKRLTVSAQRHRHACIRAFYSFLTIPQVNSLVERSTGIRVRQIAGEHTIPHIPGRPSGSGPAEIR
jgi:hypothetical protein